MAMDIKVLVSDRQEDIEPVRQGLIRANEIAAGRKAGYLPFVLHLVDHSGAVRGGATGHGSFDWLFLELLHVDEAHRALGFGSRLLAGVEDFALSNSLVGVWLDTFSFQARPFYEKHGYHEFGVIPEHPIGGMRHFMMKRLPGRADRAAQALPPHGE